MLWPRSGVSRKIICVSIHEVIFISLKTSDCTAGSEAGPRVEVQSLRNICYLPAGGSYSGKL